MSCYYGNKDGSVSTAVLDLKKGKIIKVVDCNPTQTSKDLVSHECVHYL